MFISTFEKDHLFAAVRELNDEIVRLERANRTFVERHNEHLERIEKLQEENAQLRHDFQNLLLVLNVKIVVTEAEPARREISMSPKHGYTVKSGC